MVFNLTEKLSNVFRGLGNRWRLNEKDSDEALRQIRLALLEADVNFKVVKDFTAWCNRQIANFRWHQVTLVNSSNILPLSFFEDRR